MNVLIIGSGGREHAIAWKVAQSPKVKKLWCLPGNAGIGQIAQLETATHWAQFGELSKFIDDNKIDLTIVGPEAPLCKGLVDALEAQGKRAFGPKLNGAMLEGSKIFSKEFLKKHKIPTADYEVFTDFEKAEDYVESRFNGPNPPKKLVIKADGLAAGKGVFICGNLDEAVSALSQCLAQMVFGDAGKKVIIEECLTGPEVSLLAFVDGKTLVPMVTAQDYKRVNDHDEGLNTGGMGCISPSPIFTDELRAKIMKKVMEPTLKGLKKDGIDYKGVLYTGLMIVDGEPYVLEFNCRFGDPETQVILPRLKSDLVDVMEACIDGKLGDMELEWDNQAACCVVLASGGYPGNFKKGIVIEGLEHFSPKADGVKKPILFHAGTMAGKDGILTAGGRVLNVVALDETLAGARDKVYKSIRKIHFDKMHHRNDIGGR